MTFRRALCAFFSLATTAAALSCGPSFQAIYEGNARFEHCYALEERQQTPLNVKADCWHDWSERYTFGQTRDRIHYATARYVSLSQSVPTDEAMMMAAPGMTPRTSTITAPAPTNAFAPPPKVLDSADAAPAKPSRPSEIPTIVGVGGSSVDAGDSDAMTATALPAKDCVETCAATFHGCKGAACEKTYKTCMRTCMK